MSRLPRTEIASDVGDPSGLIHELLHVHNHKGLPGIQEDFLVVRVVDDAARARGRVYLKDRPQPLRFIALRVDRI